MCCSCTPQIRAPIEESWQTVYDLIGQVSVRAAGLSDHPVQLMDRARAVGPVSVVQHQYSLLYRTPETGDSLAWCKEYGVPFLAWSPLAAGFLADGFGVATLAAGDLRRRPRWTDPAVVDLAGLSRELPALAPRAARR